MAGRAISDRRLHLWLPPDELQAPVSMAGTATPVAGVVRVGLVYTPPDRRRRGYAGALVAAVSQRALDAGATACMLFTDVANPTSNTIYQQVGYRYVGDFAEYRFAS